MRINPAGWNPKDGLGNQTNGDVTSSTLEDTRKDKSGAIPSKKESINSKLSEKYLSNLEYNNTRKSTLSRLRHSHRNEFANGEDVLND